MGTNYYLHKKNDTCPTCGHRETPLHIGKSSAGWCFSLHVYPEMGINDLPDWVERWSAPDVVIRDEYGQEVSPDEMLRACTARSMRNSAPWSDADYAGIGGIRGPNNLIRQRLDDRCVKHGEGTWDCFVGEFS